MRCWQAVHEDASGLGLPLSLAFKHRLSRDRSKILSRWGESVQEAPSKR